MMGQMLARDNMLRWFLFLRNEVVRPSADWPEARSGRTAYLPERHPPLWPKRCGAARAVTSQRDPYPKRA